MATASKIAGHQFSIVVIIFSLVFLVLFCVFGRYAPETQPQGISDFTNFSRYSPLLNDTNALVLIGLGFLVTFLRRYGFSAIAINLLLISFVLELALLVRGFVSKEFAKDGVFYISFKEIAQADYTAAAVLISYGAVVGKLSPVQYLILAAIEAPASIVNEYVVLKVLSVGDVGGSIVVHLFGAIFGIVVARVVYKPPHTHSEHQGSIYHSDIFSFIGTVFLWVFWPSFNSIFAVTSAEQHRAVINTFFALIASTLTTFLFSQMLHKDRRFNIKHIASASLSGAVAIGIVANFVIKPFPALLIGIVAAKVSVIGFQYVTPILAAKLNVHDTRGVFSLHGLPAIVGALASVVLLFTVPTDQYGDSIRNIFPNFKTDNYDGHIASEQALYQLAGLGVTIVIAAVAGVLTGVILRIPIWRQVRDKEFYADADFFDVPEDYDFTTRVTSHIERVELTEHTERTKLTTNNEA